MATHDTKLGIGLATGMFYHAPAGTALPTDPAATIPVTWEKVGDVSIDGLSLTFDKTTTDLRNMANVVKRTIMTEHAESVQATIMDTTEESLKTVLGASNVTVVAATTTHGKQITAALSQSTLPSEEAYLFVMKDDDDMMMLGTSKGQIDSMDAITFAPGESINWKPTIKGLDAGWKIIMDDGQTTS